MQLPVEILLPLLPKIGARDFAEFGKQSEEAGYSGVWVPETTGARRYLHCGGPCRPDTTDSSREWYCTDLYALTRGDGTNCSLS